MAALGLAVVADVRIHFPCLATLFMRCVRITLPSFSSLFLPFLHLIIHLALYPLYPLSLFSNISSFSISHNPPFPIPSIPTCALFSPFSDPSFLSASHHPFFLYPSLFQAVSHIVILLPNFSFAQSFILICLLTFYIESYICTVQK